MSENSLKPKQLRGEPGMIETRIDIKKMIRWELVGIGVLELIHVKVALQDAFLKGIRHPLLLADFWLRWLGNALGRLLGRQVGKGVHGGA